MSIKHWWIYIKSYVKRNMFLSYFEVDVFVVASIPAKIIRHKE